MKDALTTFVWPTIAGLLAAILILDRWVLNEPLWQPASTAVASYRDAVARATPSVVNIYTAKLVAQDRSARFNDPFLSRFSGPNSRRQRIERSLGSGVIMSAQGHIITNNHVIADADAIQVMLHDGRSAKAVVVGTDPETDLAVLQIDLPDLSPLVPANSDEINVGDVVLAIGNPYGFGHSVSQGIVSGLGRWGLQLSAYEDYIQTDASIHLGNSGGALIDSYGRLVGINTLIYTANSDGNEAGQSIGIGINLATPSNLATYVMQDLINYGRVVRGWLGVSVELLIGQDALGKQQQFLVVSAINEGGPAERAGIAVGDLILSLDDTPVTDGRLAMDSIARLRPGEQVSVGIRRGNNDLTLDAIVGHRKNSGD